MAGGRTIEYGDLVRALGRGQASFQGAVGASSTTTQINLAGIDLGTSNLAGELVMLEAGALGAGTAATLATISGNTATALTVPALSAAPATGSRLWIFGGVGTSAPLQVLADSTTTTIAAAGVYTGAAFSTASARGIIGSIFSDQSGTLQVQQSPDRTNWDIVETFYYPGGSSGLDFRVSVDTPGATQGRLVYTNGATAQTTFRLYAWTTPQPVSRVLSLPQQAAATNTITAAGTAQSLFAAMPGRHGLMIQNPSTATGQGIATAESLWIQYGADATTKPPSVEIVTGALVILDTAVDPRSISIIAATLDHAFTATQW